VRYSSIGFDDCGLEAAVEGSASVGCRSTGLCARPPHVLALLTDIGLLGLRAASHPVACVSALYTGARHGMSQGPQMMHGAEKPSMRWPITCRPWQPSRQLIRSFITMPDPSRGSDVVRSDVSGRIGDAVLRSPDDVLPLTQRVSVRLLLRNYPTGATSHCRLCVGLVLSPTSTRQRSCGLCGIRATLG
jgi:hypothetical protein